MRKWSLFAIVLLAIVSTACQGSETTTANAVEVQQQQYVKVQPIPFYEFSLERDVAIQLYNARNEARNTHTVVYTQMGQPLWDCPSIGFPIPYDVQLTNPLKTNGIEQAEPNGLYSSKNTAATWVLCVDDAGNVTPVYAEPTVIAYPFPVTVDYATGHVAKAGDSSIVLNIKAGSHTDASPQP